MLTRRAFTDFEQLHYCATVQTSFERATFVFQSLTDLTRLRIIRLLLSSDRKLCLCDLSQALNEPTYKISRHLKALRQVELISAERDGRWLFHYVPPGSSRNSLYRFLKDLKDPDGTLDRDLKQLRSCQQSRPALRCAGKGTRRQELDV